jgi:hypothetical protein
VTTDMSEPIITEDVMPAVLKALDATGALKEETR